MIFNNPSEDLKDLFSPLKIAWLFPDRPQSIGTSPLFENNPSHRLRRMQFVKRSIRGVENAVFFPSECPDSDLPLTWTASTSYFNYSRNNPERLADWLKDYDAVVIFSVDPSDGELSRILRARGKTIIFDHCENIFGLGAEDAIMENASAITCCSARLAANTENYFLSRGISKPIFVLRDPVDDSVLSSGLFTGPMGPLFTESFNPNRALVMGMGANVRYVLPFLESVCRRAGYEIFILSERGFGFGPHMTTTWELNTWVRLALTCSVALCFHDVRQFPAKGNVKATMPMSVGIPAIAVPMDSYKEAITHGYNGYIADAEQEWVGCLTSLKDTDLRNTMGARAIQTTHSRYGMNKFCLDYLAMLGYLQSQRKESHVS